MQINSIANSSIEYKSEYEVTISGKKYRVTEALIDGTLNVWIKEVHLRKEF